MKPLILPTCLAFAVLCSLTARVRADDPPAEQPEARSGSQARESGKKAQEQKREEKQEHKREERQEPGREEQRERKREQPAVEEQPEPASFVDRNGDGIQDGQEHRFRGRHRRRGRGSGDQKGEWRRQHGKHKSGGPRR